MYVQTSGQHNTCAYHNLFFIFVVSNDNKDEVCSTRPRLQIQLRAAKSSLHSVLPRKYYFQSRKRWKLIIKSLWLRRLCLGTIERYGDEFMLSRNTHNKEYEKKKHSSDQNCHSTIETLRDIPLLFSKAQLSPTIWGSSESNTDPWPTGRRGGVAADSSSAFYQSHVYGPSGNTTSFNVADLVAKNVTLYSFSRLSLHRNFWRSSVSAVLVPLKKRKSHGADNEVESETSGRLDEG